MKIFYYTASGNSLAVAKAFNGEAISIPSVLNGDIKAFEDKEIGIVTPCYVGGIPTLVEEFLQSVTLKAEYFFGIVTYGKMCFKAEAELSRLAMKSGITMSYANNIVMVDSSLKHFDMQEQIATQYEKNIPYSLQQLVEDIERRKTRFSSSNFFFNNLRKLGRHLYSKEIGDYDKKYSIEETCNNCGVCVKVCPLQNISLATKPVFHHNCIRCYACTHNCPQNAIRLAGEKSTARYRNEDVKLAEIIAANNR